MDWVTTSTILSDLRREDASAWDRFAGRFREPLLRFARASGIRDTDVEDVVQESLLRFAQALREQKFDPARGRLSRWLFGVAFRQILKQRDRYRRPESPAPPGTAGDRFWAAIPDEHTASEMWDREWEAFVFRACIDRVRHEFEPQTMRVFEQLAQTPTATEAAAALDLPVKAIYNAKHRVLRRIREIRPQVEDMA